MSAEQLHFQMKAVGLKPELEYRFHPVRRWRADFAFPEQKVLVEFEGGVYTQGRHTRGKGFENDCDKYNSAQLMGYQVYRFTRSHVLSGEALRTIEQALHEPQKTREA